MIMDTSEKEAVDLLKSLGWELKPPREYSIIPNGCFRVECKSGQVHFIEGRQDNNDEMRIREYFENMNINIKSIQFEKDQFYFL